MERIKLSKGAHVKNKIVPAISQIKNCSGTEPNYKIPLNPPNIVANKIFLISFH